MSAPSICSWCHKVGLVPSLFGPFYVCVHCQRGTTEAGLSVDPPVSVWPGLYMKRKLEDRDAKSHAVLGSIKPKRRQPP